MTLPDLCVLMLCCVVWGVVKQCNLNLINLVIAAICNVYLILC